MKKFENVPLVDFLQNVVDNNTKNYSADFDMDKKTISSAALDGWPGGKVFLWMSRENGTQCVREYEAFIKGSSAYSTWEYFSGSSSENIKAFVVEAREFKNGTSYGNVYELDYEAHVADMVKKAVEPHEVQKFFEDGYVAHVPLDRSSYGYYYDLVAEHGKIIDSLYVPEDEAALSEVLAEQKRKRDKFPLAKDVSVFKSAKGSIDDLLTTATLKSKEIAYTKEDTVPLETQNQILE